ncbi:MAG: sortase [Oscillibacter sp.]|jgi:sortase A|nr:sortase [Oscillibacter sp.]
MKIKKGTLCMTLGLLLVVAALSLTAYNLWDERRAAESADAAMAGLEEKIPRPEELNLPAEMIPDYILNPNMDMPVVEIDGYQYIGWLEIPALDLDLPVMDSWSYPQLKLSPCRYSGSAYLDNMAIAAHNYKRHFGGLRDLDLGEEVRFTDVDGNLFVYQTAALEQLEPTQTKAVQDSEWDLTLFTCTLGGQFRVALRCERVEEVEK